MARGLVLRAWSDLSTTGQYSILHRNGCASLIPIPETSAYRRPCFLRPDCLLSPCTLRPLSFYMVRYTPVLHNDPRLDKGFYTGYWAPRGRLPRALSRGDLLLFVAGLVHEDYARRADKPGKLVQRGFAGIYFVGGIVVEDIVDVGETGWRRALEKWPRLVYSPHYWRRGDTPVAVIGSGFVLRPPLPASAPGTLREPSEAAKEILGNDAAWGLARSRFRRSRLIPMALELVERAAQRHGSRIVAAGQYVCSAKCLSGRRRGSVIP